MQTFEAKLKQFNDFSEEGLQGVVAGQDLANVHDEENDEQDRSRRKNNTKNTLRNGYRVKDIRFLCSEGGKIFEM